MPLVVQAFLDIFACIPQLLQPLNGCALTNGCPSSEGESRKNNFVHMTTEEEGGDGAKLLGCKVILYCVDNILVIE